MGMSENRGPPSLIVSHRVFPVKLRVIHGYPGIHFQTSPDDGIIALVPRSLKASSFWSATLQLVLEGLKARSCLKSSLLIGILKRRQ